MCLHLATFFDKTTFSMILFQQCGGAVKPPIFKIAGVRVAFFPTTDLIPCLNHGSWITLWKQSSMSGNVESISRVRLLGSCFMLRGLEIFCSSLEICTALKLLWSWTKRSSKIFNSLISRLCCIPRYWCKSLGPRYIPSQAGLMTKGAVWSLVTYYQVFEGMVCISLWFWII